MPIPGWRARPCASAGFCALMRRGAGRFPLLAAPAYPLYGARLLLLVAVDVAGEIGMGAQRWIDLGFIQLQPSELMKIALVLVLARYFHGLSYEDIGAG